MSIPVVGCGGVAGPDDALAMIMAGASAVEVGAALFADFSVINRIHDGLVAALESRGMKNISELVGLARK